MIELGILVLKVLGALVVAGLFGCAVGLLTNDENPR